MKITVWTRNHVRTTLDESQIVSQVRHTTAAGQWVSVTLKDGRNLQLENPVPGILCEEHDATSKKKKTYLQKIDDSQVSPRQNPEA